MAQVASLACAGAATFAAPGDDPNAPVRKADLHVWVGAKPTSNTAAGTPGEYFCDGNYNYICFATNRWARHPVDSSWT